jgi:hypothetical protein
LGRRWRRLTGLAKTESSSDARRTKCGRADNLSSADGSFVVVSRHVGLLL